MKYIEIPNTELSVSRMAYGSWHLGGEWNKSRPLPDVNQRAVQLVKTAVDCGINHIDLADIYSMGKSDQVVGHALRQNKGLRNKLVLQEKCGIVLARDPDFGPPQRYDLRYKHIIASVETSLSQVGTDRFDILTLHRPDLLADYEEVAHAFDELHRTGKVRYFGASNYSIHELALLQQYSRQRIVLNQLEASLLNHGLISSGLLANVPDSRYAHCSGLLNYCRLNQIFVQAWSPTAGGAIFSPLPISAARQALVNELERIARCHSTNTDAIVIAWLLRHPAPIQPVLGTQNTERMIRSAEADSVELSRCDWYSLLEAARGEPVP